MTPRLLAAAATALLCSACAGSPPPPGAGAGTGFKPCPNSPNCVSSRAGDEAHRVDPLPLRGSAAQALAAVRQVVLALPRTKIVAEGPAYLHAECRSLVFRFVDDVEFVLDEAAGVIHVRSAARVGHSDLGVNRRRVETIRARLTSAEPPKNGPNR